MADMNKGGDVRSVYLCRDDKNLYIRVDCVRRLTKRITYIINLRGLNRQNQDSRYSVVLYRYKANPPGTVWAYNNNVLEVAVPLTKIDIGQALFIQVKTSFVKFTVDNTGWQEVPSGN